MANYVLIEGPTGCGKTALIDAFCRNTQPATGGGGTTTTLLMGRGKFEDPMAAPRPLSAILDAIDQILHHIYIGEDKQIWIGRFKSDLGPDIVFLKKHLTKLEILMQNENNRHDESSLSTGEAGGTTTGGGSDKDDQDSLLGLEKDWSFQRMRLGLRSLVRCIAKYETTIMAIDDIQWADRDSLEVMRTILSDNTSFRRLLFIAMNRMAQPHQQPHRLFEALREKRSIRLRLTNLHSDSVTELVADLLQRNTSSVKPVVKVLMQKTNGDPFAVLHLLRRMEQEGFLLYTPLSGWEWDIPLLKVLRDSQERTPPMFEKLRSLDSTKQEALVTVAFLGSSCFRAQSIVEANADKIREGNGMNGSNTHNPSDQPLSAKAVEEKSKIVDAVLRSLVQDGLIEKLEEEFYHIPDRVREAAYNMVPQGRPRAEMHLRFGRNLNLRLQDMAETGVFSDKYLVFKCTSQLNRGAALITDNWEQIDLVELNYQAAEDAMTQCSQARALGHVDQGLRLLGREPWKNNFDWAKKLSTARCRLLSSCGLHDDAERAADVVISRTQSFSDQKIAYETKIQSLQERGQHKDALQACLALLNDMGIQMPRRAAKGHVARHIVKIRKMLRGRAESEILDIPMTSDETLRDTAYFLELLGRLAIRADSPDYQTLGHLRIVQMTLEDGRVPSSALALVSWGCVLIEMGELEEALLYGRIGVQISEEDPKSRYNLRARMKFYTSLALWKYTLTDCLEYMPDEIKLMNEVGAIEDIQDFTADMLRLHFFSNKPLAEVSESMWQYACLLRDYQQWHTYGINVSFFQMVSNMMGAASDLPTTLRGDYMDEITQLNEWRRMENDKALQMFYYCSTFLSFLFGDLQVADEQCNRLTTTYEEGPQLWFPIVVFLKGLVSLAMSGATGSRKHRRQGDAAVKQMELWTNAGCVNTKHMLHILLAEQYSLDSGVNPETVKTAWDLACSSSQKAGFLAHTALAYELAGVYFRQSEQDYHAKSYLSRARAVYREWGCDSKIALMHSRYSDTLEPVSDALSVSSGRSYERISFRRAAFL
jgi:predicted ATPase